VSTIGFISTVLSLPATFTELASELVPEADVFHIADETLLGVTRREGRLTPTTRRRVLGYIESAADAGADLVVVTCSSIGPAVDDSRGFVDVPVLRIDQPMADEAVRLGSRVGVVATLSTTLEPTAALVRARAQAAGKDVEVTAQLCEGAFGSDRHDELVRAGIEAAAAENDVVVLAQASMARVAVESPVPVLSSPRLGMQRVAELLRSAA
jgi:Asp/Glu/hydantoin racemase